MMKTELYNRKTDCCGCGACANICPKNLIEMHPDSEGFLYPQIKNHDMCIGCGKCEKVCPVQHADEIRSQFDEAWAGWCSDGSGVHSASGGAAYAIAMNSIANGGIVYGVRYADDYKSAEYMRCESDDDIRALRSSKYIQSRKNDVYKQIKADLDAGKNVLFFGLPCDTFAIKRYIGSSLGGLVTVSLICHGPTSEKVHKSFCETVEKKYGSEVNSINVRYKKNGQWKPYYIYACLKNGKKYLKKFQATDYDVAFQNFKRPSCTDCRFRKDHYSADLLIGDFHSAQKGTESYNSSGVSSILPLTDVGRDILRQIQNTFTLYKVDLKSSTSQRGIHSSVKSSIDRVAFAEALNEKGLHAACQNSDVVAEKRKKQRQRAVHSVKKIIYKILKFFKFV